MKIENSIQPITGVAVSGGQRQVDKTTNTNQSENNVHLSSPSAKLQHADKSASSGAVVDTARVEEIKQAINEGSFRVNPEAVADRLLETAKELIDSKKDNA